MKTINKIRIMKRVWTWSVVIKCSETSNKIWEGAEIFSGKTKSFSKKKKSKCLVRFWEAGQTVFLQNFTIVIIIIEYLDKMQQ